MEFDYKTEDSGIRQALLERKEVTVIASIDSCLDYLIPLELWKNRAIHSLQCRMPNFSGSDENEAGRAGI